MRAAWLDIDLAALRHNFQIVRRHAPTCRTAAVIKANAYGHGLLPVARTLMAAGADALAVSLVGEAQALRDAGLNLPILVLQGAFRKDDWQAAASHDFALTIHTETQLQQLSSQRLTAPLDIWLKLDTGMHRLGFKPENLPSLLARVQSLANVRTVTLMTHLACADQPDSGSTRDQLNRFATAANALPQSKSVANSAAILAWPQAHYDWVRPGIMLYGASPFGTSQPLARFDLRPVMALRAPLIAIQHCTAGDQVGYGGTWTCPQTMPIGIIGAGYADGYPRHAGNDTPVLVDQAIVRLVGRVSMDMLAVDLRNAPGACVGSTATLWGAGLPVEEIAAAAGTISYELLCNAGAHVRAMVRDAV